MPKKLPSKLTEDEWIEQYGINALRFRELPGFMDLLEQFPDQYSSILSILQNQVSLTDEVYGLLEQDAPPVVFEKLEQWHTIPEHIRSSFLHHIQLPSILTESTTDVWETIPAELVRELPTFRQPGKILQAAKNNPEFTPKYQALPEEVRAILHDDKRPGSMVLQLEPGVLDSIPKQLQRAFLMYSSVYTVEASPNFHWNTLSPQEQEGLKENTNVGAFIKYFNPAVWTTLPPRVRVLAAANFLLWKQFFEQPYPPVWRDVPEEYLELSAAHGQTALFCSAPAVETFLYDIPRKLRTACIRSRDLNFLMSKAEESDWWSTFPTIELARKVIDTQYPHFIVRESTQERWEAIPKEFHDLLAQHPALYKILTRARPEFWELVPKHMMIRFLNDNALLKKVLDADDYKDYRPQIDEFLQEEMEISKQHERLVPDVSSDTFRAVMLPLLLRQKVHPSAEVERLIERQAERLRQAYVDVQEAPEALPTIGYELEFERLYADAADYKWLHRRGAWKRGGDKAYEIASNVFPSGRLAALSMFSLLHSGLVAQAELRPALFSLHVNLGIPPVFAERLPNNAQARELQQSLLPGHTSAERLSKREWDIPVEMHSRQHVEGDAAGRVELRVHDVHDMWVYSLLQKAPEATQLWLADYAEQQGIEYVPNQRELAEQWQRLREEQQLNHEATLAPELLGRKKFVKPNK